MTRRGIDAHGITDYIRIRQHQLREEAEKCSNPEDAAWYYRIIQELDWAMFYKDR
jgi:hypothetical protein